MSEDEPVVEAVEDAPVPDTPAPPETPIVAPLPAKSRRWMVNILLGLLIFACGAVTGGGVALRVAWNRVSTTLQHPEQAPAKSAQRLTRVLRLDEKQSAEVKAILERRFETIGALRREIAPRIDAELESLRDEISAVLHPDQVQRWTRIFDNLRPRLFSPNLKEKPQHRPAN